MVTQRLAAGKLALGMDSLISAAARALAAGDALQALKHVALRDDAPALALLFWVDGDLWHGTWEGDASDIRRIDPASGAVLQTLQMPPGANVSGLESDGAGLFYAGGGGTGKVRAVRRPKRSA
jgi:hypothetical protein